MAKPSKIRITPSSGNIFADLRLPNAGEKHTKVRLALTINKILKEKALRQEAAAKLLELNQPKISALANYQLEGFSVERLLLSINALGHDVAFVIRRKQQSKRTGMILVTVA